MKLSVMSYTLARQGWKKDNRFDLVGMAELAVKLGIDGVDMVTTYGLDPREVRRILDDHGVKTVCYTFDVALNHPTRAERRKGVDQVKAGLDTAAALGTDKIMVVTPGNPAFPRDISRRNWIGGLQECVPLAKQAGITMTIENFPGPDSPFVISSDVLEAVREAPGLKITYDNGNVFTGGEDPAVSFQRCAAHVVHAHFKDWSAAPAGSQSREMLDGRCYQAALIGEGLVDHKACLAAMKTAGYAGYINIEYENNRYRPDEATERAARYLQGLIGELE